MVDKLENLLYYFRCVTDHLADGLHDFILVHLGPIVVIENVATYTDVPNLAYLFLNCFLDDTPSSSTLMLPTVPEKMCVSPNSSKTALDSIGT